jgi:predicted DNA-binding antitoxin AbrB/MazE fold protein
MTIMVVQAIYASGVLKPTKKLNLPEGTSVEVEIKVLPTTTPVKPLTFAKLAGIWSHLTNSEVEQLEQAIVETRQQSAIKIERLARELLADKDSPDE